MEAFSCVGLIFLLKNKDLGVNSIYQFESKKRFFAGYRTGETRIRIDVTTEGGDKLSDELVIPVAEGLARITLLSENYSDKINETDNFGYALASPDDIDAVDADRPDEE